MNKFDTITFLNTLESYISYGNLVLVALPIYKMIKGQIRCYQTPFLFVFAVMAYNLSFIGATIFLGKTIIEPIVYTKWIITVITLLISISIIFGDQEISIGIKILIFFVFLAIEAIFFCAPLIIKDRIIELAYYMYLTLYSIGSFECFIGSLILKQHFIIPILNVILMLCHNIISIYPFTLIYEKIICIIGIILCFFQIVTYLVLRKKENNKENQKERLSTRIEALAPLAPEPVYQVTSFQAKALFIQN